MTRDSTTSVWAYATATWLVLMSLPFIAFPRFLLFLSSTSGSEHRGDLTPLESFLSIHFAILALSVAAGVLVSIPTDSPITPRQATSTGHPMLFPVTLGSLFSAFLSHNTPASQVGPLAFFMALGAGTIGLWGIWVLLFAGSSQISRKTGADKHTSRFLFGNRSAASVQKKQWKREQKMKER